MKALAAGKFADPSDALAFLGDTGKYVGEDDSINTDTIAADLAALLDSKPHLASQQAPNVPRPNPAQGASGSAPETGAPQLSKADLDRMSRDGQYDEIAAARKAGQFNELLGIKP